MKKDRQREGNQEIWGRNKPREKDKGLEEGHLNH